MMRIEIDDFNAQRHTIDTMDARLAGEWFAEWSQRLMSADARLGDCRFRVWPSTHEEAHLIGDFNGLLTDDDLLVFADKILQASKLASARKERSATQ